MTRGARVDLAALPASLRARNPQRVSPADRLPVAPPAPAKRPGRGSARPGTPRALPGPQDAAGVVVVELPGLVTRSEMNTQVGGRWDRTRRRDAAHAAVEGATRHLAPPPLPVRVCIARRAPGTADLDNLGSATKATQDAIAEWLGVDDGVRDTRVEWRRTQERTPRGVYGVRVTLVPIDGRGSIAVGERADVVRLSIDREQAGEIVRGLLSQDGGHARVECGGVVVEMTVEARR